MSVQSLDRAFDILELLSKQRSALSITEISKELELHKSTVFRLLNTLKKRGYIRQNTETAKYYMGYEFIELCSSYLSNLELKTEAEPVLRELSRKTTQTVFLGILRDHEVMYIDKVEQYNSLRRYSIIGTKTPLHCSALGKSLLTGMDENEIRDIYKNLHFQIFTKNTIQDIETLLDEIRESRINGWTFDNEEFEKGVQCLASPIRDYRGKVFAAVSTSWNLGSPPEINKNQIAEYIKAGAMEISMHMGYKS